MRRETREVDVEIRFGERMKVETGDEILDHMIESMLFYMEKKAEVKVNRWDLRHHLWEDVGIVLGDEMRKSFVDGRKIARFGHCIIPMDDALVLIAVDISSRPFLNFDLDFPESEEGFEPTLIKEFLMALSRRLGMTIHVKKLDGMNAHHISEATFKGLGKALSQALMESERLESTKGDL